MAEVDLVWSRYIITGLGYRQLEIPNMANIHFKKHLIHQCTVQRNTPAASGSGELIPSWADGDTIDCRYVEKRERIASEGVGLMMLEQHILLCDIGEDLLEEDRITNITLKSDSSVIDAGPFTVEEALNRSSASPHHMSFRLERVE